MNKNKETYKIDEIVGIKAPNLSNMKSYEEKDKAMDHFIQLVEDKIEQIRNEFKINPKKKLSDDPTQALIQQLIVNSDNFK